MTVTRNIQHYRVGSRRLFPPQGNTYAESESP